MFYDNSVVEMLIRLVSLLYFKSIQSVANVLSSSTLVRTSPSELLQKVHRYLQQEESLDELFDHNLRAESKVNEKTLYNMTEKTKEKWEKGRFNIQRYFFHKLKGVFELLFEVLHLSVFNNTLYSLAFFSQGDLFLNLLVFFPDQISTLLSEITRNIGRVTFFDSRFAVERTRPSFTLEDLVEKEGHLYRPKLLRFRNGFFSLSNRFINRSYQRKVKPTETEEQPRANNIEFPHAAE